MKKGAEEEERERKPDNLNVQTKPFILLRQRPQYQDDPQGVRRTRSHRAGSGLATSRVALDWLD